MGEEFGVSDATDREEKALRQLTSRMVDYYGKSHSPELVRDLVGQVRRRFDGHAVRDFVPILIERIVHREIQHLPAHRGADDARAAEHAAAQHVPAAQPVPATVELPVQDADAAADAEAAGKSGDGADNTAAEPVSADVVGHPTAASTGQGGAPAMTDAAQVDTKQSDETSRFDAEPARSANDPNVADETTAQNSGPAAALAAGSDPVSSAAAPADSAPTVREPDPGSADIALRLDTSGPGGGETDSTTPVAPQSTSPSAASASRTSRRSSDGNVPGWRGRPRLIAALAAAVVVVIALVVGFGFGGSDKPAAPAAAATMVTAHGVVGSEKMAFFSDPRVVDVFAHNGIRLQVDPAGSRQIATSVDLSDDDFAFPSSTLAAERIQRQRGVTTKYTPFSSPMAIASFGPIVDALTRAGVVRPGATPTFDMRRYLDLAQQGAQWDQLEGNTGYPVRKSVLLSTTDPRTSNSAAMYLAAAAYVANDDSIVQGPAAENFVLSKVTRLFTKQGYTDNSSEGPFTEYLTAGMGPTPMVWSYESQYVEAAVAGKLPANSVLLYPSPTVLSRHTLVPLNATGDRIGRLLTTDPDLQRLAAEHGFRTADPAQFAKVTAEHHIPAVKDVVDVVDTPTYDTLEHLLDGVARSYN